MSTDPSMKIMADHFLDLLNEGANLIERGNRYIEAEDGPDGFVAAYRWPKVGSWHRILHWYDTVNRELLGLGERRSQESQRPPETISDPYAGHDGSDTPVDGFGIVPVSSEPPETAR